MNSKKSLIAYTLPDLPFGITLDVKASANAWWMDKAKVLSLFNAFKIDATIPEACAFVNITEKQYKYFLSKHPEVTEIREGYKLSLMMIAKMNIARAIQNGDMKTCWRYLAKRLPYEYGNRVGREKPISLPKPKRVPIDDKEKERLDAATKAYNEVFKRQTIEEIRAMPN